MSPDPLTKNYAFYSPYHFAGNNPVRNVDLDGGEPKDYINNWIYKPVFDLNSQKQVGSANDGVTVDDPKLGKIDVNVVYDKWTNQTWFVHQDDFNNYFYFSSDNGNNSEMTIHPNKIAGSNEVKEGHFEKFETQDAKQGRLMTELAEGTATFFAAAIVAPFAVEGMTVTGGGPLWSASVPQTFQIGAAKALIGGAADLLAQKTVNGWDSKVNWYETGISAGASAFGLNPYTGAAALNFVQLDEKFNPVTPFSPSFDFKAYGLNVLLNGASGSAVGAAHLDPAVGLGLGNNAARTGGSTIFNYWGNTIGGAATSATTTPSQPPANTTNNDSKKTDDTPE